MLTHHPPSILHTSQQRSNGRSAIELALQQVQRAGKHSWIQEKNSEREFQRKFFLLIPLSTAKRRRKPACTASFPSYDGASVHILASSSSRETDHRLSFGCRTGRAQGSLGYVLYHPAVTQQLLNDRNRTVTCLLSCPAALSRERPSRASKSEIFTQWSDGHAGFTRSYLVTL